MILILLSVALYKQINGNEHLKDIPDAIKRHIESNGIFVFIFLFFLMLLNWSLEAFKWKLLISKLTPITFLRSFRAVWTGVTLGMFTPNRIGEFGGRILYIPKKYRLHGIVASLIGSFSTILVTINTGIICVIIFCYHKLELESLVFLSISVISILFGTLILLAYFNLNVLVHIFRKIKIFRRIRPYTEVLDMYSVREYIRFIVLSLLRYAVFTAQYLVFLRMFGIPLTVGQGVTAIGVIYLAQTIFPTFALIELLARGNIAVIFLKYYSDNTLAPVAATTCMWLLNLITPAVLGYFFILRYNFFKNKNGS